MFDIKNGKLRHFLLFFICSFPLEWVSCWPDTFHPFCVAHSCFLLPAFGPFCWYLFCAIATMACDSLSSSLAAALALHFHVRKNLSIDKNKNGNKSALWTVLKTTVAGKRGHIFENNTFIQSRVEAWKWVVIIEREESSSAAGAAF